MKNGGALGKEDRNAKVITSEALRAAADELDEQREILIRLESLFVQCRDLVLELKGSGERTHTLLVEEANRLGTDVTTLRNRMGAVERALSVQTAE